MKKVILMAPAGSYETLMSAIHAGADAVYFGVGKLNMRARASKNFGTPDLHKVAKLCKKHGVESYLTLNTIIYDEDMEEMQQTLIAAKEANVSAVIASDMAVIRAARTHGLSVHISTQANITNFQAVRFYSQFADVVVLARELNLVQIERIIQQIYSKNITGPNNKSIQVELFIHGAMCVSIAGKCYMSLAQTNHSANRGDCLQPCRRRYKVIDDHTGDELAIENPYVMSPRDLCTIRFLDKIIRAGVSVLKIEGRGRSADYVYEVTRVYREAIDAFFTKKYTLKKISDWEKRLERVYNRGFWHGGYYLGQKLGEWSGVYGSKATKEKHYVGVATNYYQRPKIAEFYIEKGEIRTGDEIVVIGSTTGYLAATVTELRSDDKSVTRAERGQTVTTPLSRKIRPNDKLFIIRDRKINPV